LTPSWFKVPVKNLMQSGIFSAFHIYLENVNSCVVEGSSQVSQAFGRTVLASNDQIPLFAFFR
jgi:hypothetical protein